MTEAAQWPIVFPREARKFFSDLLFNGQETALVVSRYIEGHHAYCFSHYRPTSSTQPAHSTSRLLQFTCSMNQINVFILDQTA